VLSSKFLTCY